MDDELIEFEEYLCEYEQEIMDRVQVQMEEALKKNVQSELYDSYNPKVYTRTNNLKKSITSSDDDDETKVYFDESKLNYTSAIDGHNVSAYVPKFVNEGHHDNKGNGEYHDYKGRNFMEKTVNELEKRYGKNSFVIDDNA